MNHPTAIKCLHFKIQVMTYLLTISLITGCLMSITLCIIKFRNESSTAINVYISRFTGPKSNVFIMSCFSPNNNLSLFSVRSFEKMAKNMRHDLDSVQSARKHKDPPPKFHYESRSFSIVK